MIRAAGLALFSALLGGAIALLARKQPAVLERTRTGNSPGRRTRARHRTKLCASSSRTVGTGWRSLPSERIATSFTGT